MTKCKIYISKEITLVKPIFCNFQSSSIVQLSLGPLIPHPFLVSPIFRLDLLHFLTFMTHYKCIPKIFVRGMELFMSSQIPGDLRNLVHWLINPVYMSVNRVRQPIDKVSRIMGRLACHKFFPLDSVSLCIMTSMNLQKKSCQFKSKGNSKGLRIHSK